jgi:hypothetical protein
MGFLEEWLSNTFALWSKALMENELCSSHFLGTLEALFSALIIAVIRDALSSCSKKIFLPFVPVFIHFHSVFINIVPLRWNVVIVRPYVTQSQQFTFFLVRQGKLLSLDLICGLRICI